MHLLGVCVQAQRARTLGAIVYCVGVKDFNQTQVHNTVQKLSLWSLKTSALFVCRFTKPIGIILYCVLVGYHCRHHWSCVSCCGRFPRPEGDDWFSKFSSLVICLYNEVKAIWLYCITDYAAVWLFLYFQIIKKSCIEILAAEPSSVCAGGTSFTRGLPNVVCLDCLEHGFLG